MNRERTVSKNEILLPATFSSLEKISDFVQSRSHQSHLSFKKTWEVMLAIDEICCNIIAHARPLGGQHALYLTWQDEPEAVTIFVSDKGIPFNPLLPCTEEKEVLEENRRLGGMGPHLIEKMLDKVSYRRENGFNHLCLCKFKSRRNNRCACSSRKKTTEKTAE